MFLWSNLSELDAKYLQLITITRTPVHTLPATGVKTLCANPVTFEEQNHKETGETCIFLDSCQVWRSPRGSPSAHGSVSPHRPPSWQTIPKGMLLRVWGCFYASKVPAQLPPGCKWKEWQDFYCWESLSRAGSEGVVANCLGDARQMLWQLGQNLGLPHRQETAPASHSWAQATCKDGCTSKEELWFPAEDSGRRGITIYSTSKGFFSRKPTYCCKGTANHHFKMASLKLLSTKHFGQ